MKYKLINTSKGIQEALESLKDNVAIGIDIETTSLAPRDGEISLIQLSNGVRDTTYIIDVIELDGSGSRTAISKMSLEEKSDRLKNYKAPEGLKLLIPFLEADKPRKVIQNAKFELTWFKEVLGCEINGIFDTYLAGKLVNMESDCKLDTLLQVHLGITVSKEEQKSDWSGVLTKEQLEYAADDAFNLPALRSVLVNLLRQEEMLEIAAIEFNAVPAVARMETVGFPIDTVMYHSLIEELQIRRDLRAKELEAVLNEAMGYTVTTTVQAGLFGDDKVITTGGVNLNSPAQVKEAFKRLGVDLPSTGKLIINQMVDKNPQLKYLTSYRAEQILVTSFGQKMINCINPKTGRIHANYWMLKPATGRFATSNPNLQQIPHTKEFRECFRPDNDERCFVIADYSGIELRILAQLAQDEVMIDIFNNNGDLHSSTAIAAFGLKCSEKEVKTLFPEKRLLAKGLNFGVVYGIGANKYAVNTGISVLDAKKAIKGFYDKYKGVTKYLYGIEDFGIKHRFVRSLGGRKMRLHFESLNEMEVGMAKRNARNYPIQATSADILKLAMGMLYKRLKGYDADIIHVVHDEILIECPKKDAHVIKEILETTMIEAADRYLPDVMIEAEANICTSWADK